MLKNIFKIFVELTGHPHISRLLKRFTLSRFSRFLNKPFAKVYQLDLGEMEKPLTEYKNLHELFTRKLVEGIRCIDGSDSSLVSPVDGIVTACGLVSSKSTFHVKGHDYKLEEMLGSKDKSTEYNNSHYFVIYLSPKHYHRVHCPINGVIVDQWTLGEKSVPVNELGFKLGKQPLSSNYRVISEVMGGNGKTAVVKIGALNINSIYLSDDLFMDKGKEMGYFSFGSTVVLLIQDPNFKINSFITDGMEVKMGMPLGEFCSKNGTSLVIEKAKTEDLAFNK